MSNYLTHNKYHRTVHHTVSSAGFPDSASDPIAAPGKEFLGTFFNILSASTQLPFVQVSSKDWFNNFTHSKTYSADWNKYLTTFSTTTTFSANWSSGFSAYNTLTEVSANYISMYSTYRNNSAYWHNIANSWRVNEAQEDTKQKYFNAQTLPNVSNLYNWDLDTQQIAFIELLDFISHLEPPNNQRKGGEYVLIMRNDQLGNKFITFDPVYILNTDSPGIFLHPFGVTIIRFISDGINMYGKVTQYYYGLGTFYTFFDGGGISLDPNPGGLNAGDAFEVGTQEGLIIQSVAPYTGGDGISIIEDVLPS